MENNKIKRGSTLKIKKVTLRDLDEPETGAVAGGVPLSLGTLCPTFKTCPTCIKCA